MIQCPTVKAQIPWGLEHYKCNCVRSDVLAGALLHTVWATDLADEDTPRETLSEIETSVPLTSFQTDEGAGKQRGSDGCQRTGSS